MKIIKRSFLLISILLILTVLTEARERSHQSKPSTPKKKAKDQNDSGISVWDYFNNEFTDKSVNSTDNQTSAFYVQAMKGFWFGYNKALYSIKNPSLSNNCLS